MPNRAVTVTTTEGQIVPFHENRKTLVIYNNGTDTVYLSNDPQNVATSGLPLAVGGAAVAILSEGDEPYMAVHSVAASGSQNLRILEGFGEHGLRSFKSQAERQV